MYIIGSSIGSRARHKKWEMLSDDFFGMDGFQWGKHFETDVSSTNRRTYVYIYIYQITWVSMLLLLEEIRLTS